jgi:hypothetical protein
MFGVEPNFGWVSNYMIVVTMCLGVFLGLFYLFVLLMLIRLWSIPKALLS